MNNTITEIIKKKKKQKKTRGINRRINEAEKQSSNPEKRMVEITQKNKIKKKE